jgi:hypothetical protein
MLYNSDPSLFSPQALSVRAHRALLIQFLLSEMIEGYRAASEGRWDLLLTAKPCFFPYDWASTTGYLNKIWEHSSCLKKSFPDQAKVVKGFEKIFAKQLDSLSKKRRPAQEHFEIALQKLYSALEPLIEFCKEDENLLFFLLKHRKEIDLLTQKGYLHRFILKIHPSGLESLGEKMCDQYHQRGFFSQISEFKLLLTELLHA